MRGIAGANGRIVGGADAGNGRARLKAVREGAIALRRANSFLRLVRASWGRAAEPASARIEMRGKRPTDDVLYRPMAMVANGP